MRVEAARPRCGYSVLANKTHTRNGGTAGGRLANGRCCCVFGLVGDVLEQLRMVVVRVVAAHDLASFEQRVGLVRDAGLRLGTGFATADLAALGVVPCIRINQPMRDAPPPHVGILTEKFQAV